MRTVYASKLLLAVACCTRGLGNATHSISEHQNFPAAPTTFSSILLHPPHYTTNLRITRKHIAHLPLGLRGDVQMNKHSTTLAMSLTVWMRHHILGMDHTTTAYCDEFEVISCAGTVLSTSRQVSCGHHCNLRTACHVEPRHVASHRGAQRAFLSASMGSF